MTSPYRTSELSASDAELLLARAGLPGRVLMVRPCAGGVANLNHELKLDTGRHLLLRTYQDPRSRVVEIGIDELLARTGIACPRLVAVPTELDNVGVFDWIDGVRLRDTRDVDRAKIESAWRTAGTQLRAINELSLPAPQDADWLPRRSASAWIAVHAATLRDAAERLARNRIIRDTQQRNIDELADRADEFIGSYAPRLLHGDAHAANVLVRSGGSWEFAAWIDWERAEIGDAESDLATFEVFTRAQVGSIPQAFWDGYGRAPELRKFRFYELVTVLFLASHDRAQQLPPGREARRAVVDRLDAMLEVFAS